MKRRKHYRFLSIILMICMVVNILNLDSFAEIPDVDESLITLELGDRITLDLSNASVSAYETSSETETGYFSSDEDVITINDRVAEAVGEGNAEVVYITADHIATDSNAGMRVKEYTWNFKVMMKPGNTLKSVIMKQRRQMQ